MTERTDSQTSMIKNLAVHLRMGSNWSDSWIHTLSADLLRSLYGVRRLKLVVEADVDARVAQELLSNDALLQKCMASALIFQKMPLDEASIVTYDMGQRFYQRPWTSTDRIEIASHMEYLLLQELRPNEAEEPTEHGIMLTDCERF